MNASPAIQASSRVSVGSKDLLDLSGEYEIVYADPPWQYNDRLGDDPAWGAMTYRTMTLEAIKALPVRKIAAKDSVLLMWVTWPMLNDGLEVIKAWGYKYKTLGFMWVKKNPSDCGFFFGLGHWTRSNCEVCLLATKGTPKRESNMVSQLVFEPRSRHSAKPASIRERIVELLGDRKRCELFAREKTPGWEAWGNEV